jgi:hypothetical protein
MSLKPSRTPTPPPQLHTSIHQTAILKTQLFFLPPLFLSLTDLAGLGVFVLLLLLPQCLHDHLAVPGVGEVVQHKLSLMGVVLQA